MTRKDSEKDTDRPHYYSQFWLDVAAGRTVIGAPKVEEEAELAEAELEMPEPTPLRKPGRSTASATDGYKPARAQTVVEPAFAPEEFAEPEENEFEQAYEVDDLELPNIVVEETEEETTIPPEEEEAEEEEEEELFYDEEEAEEEEEDSWGARGRKKPKPGRQVKPPKPLKKPKREPRRGF
ncbi:MAG TPA: hypothetical protein VF844_02765 [Ktedonobacteraceae bacterium]